MESEICAECKQAGIVARDVVPYSVLNSKGRTITKWLHGACTERWFGKYRAWRQSLERGVAPSVSGRGGDRETNGDRGVFPQSSQ